MSKLTDFLEAELLPIQNEKVVVTERLKDMKGNPIEFEIRALTENEVNAIRKASKVRIKTKNGYKTEIDSNLMGSKMVVESIVFPDLKSEEVQNKFKVIGAENVLPTILTGGEYADLVNKVQEISGYDIDMDELVEEAKN